MTTFAQMFRPKIIARDNKKMAELTSDLYKELLRYKTQDNNYFRQPIDLFNYKMKLNNTKAA
ncbi:hypothetical protein [Prochlorococcus marinus]|uniref:hypothetical protein n=1 Tax=Prochlorococcus marinus TaxID=1219 RepID=UPI0022B2C588|nr:hypothetical protein [Prochlorococcus marinus]